MGGVGGPPLPSPHAAEAPRPGVYCASPIDGPLRQGEILSELPQALLNLESLSGGGQPFVDESIHPLAIVLSQDCDLEQDYKARHSGPGTLPNVLFCEVHESAIYRDRLRVQQVGDSKTWKNIKQNKNERFQYLRAARAAEDADGTGLPELLLDFRMHFTIPTAEVYLRLTRTTRRRCRLESPYLEHLVRRFFAFHSRVALPEDHAAGGGDQG